MEDFKLDIIIDQGPNARSVSLTLPRFTLIGATTRSGLLSAPLLTRFPIRERLDYYQAGQLQQIVARSARILDVETEEQGAREIARRFNFLYGETFPVPDVLVSEQGSLVGTDGAAKMSKSLGNAIYLSDDAKTVAKKVMGMYTDPRRVSADIPGTVEGNPVFDYHDAFNMDKAEVEDLKDRYRAGKVGDVEVKEKLIASLNAFLDPIRERRAKYESQSGLADEVVYDGTMKMREEARATLNLATKAMGLAAVWNRISRKAEEVKKRRGTK